MKFVNKFGKWRIFITVRRMLSGIHAFLHKNFDEYRFEIFYELDLRKGESQPINKRALLSYIVRPFSFPRDDPRFLRHINIWHAREMVIILNQMGYRVDVIDYRDTDFSPRNVYDLFIGHGGINFESIARQLPDNTPKIYFSTGAYWRFHNRQELARFAALKKRRGVDLTLDRLIENSEDTALLASDGIIGIGNRFTRETYADFSPVILINGTALEDDYEQQDKDYQKGKNHFLYFAGAGPVHKGLDLLLEAFGELEQHLWICSKINQQFEQVYYNELHNVSNIHFVGWVRSRSAKFYEIITTCNYVILPSCSEGQAQSVLECMKQGLIPIVSSACGLDVGNFGILIDPCTIAEIITLVKKLSAESANWHRTRSVAAREMANRAFSEQMFRKKFKEAILKVIDYEKE